jgi:hypothetical protein
MGQKTPVVDAWLYCFLPGGNSGEFDEIEAGLRLRSVIAEAADVVSGGRVYRVHRSCLGLLPSDEDGPYLGDEDSGYGLKNWQGPEGKGPWRRVFWGA